MRYRNLLLSNHLRIIAIVVGNYRTHPEHTPTLRQLFMLKAWHTHGNPLPGVVNFYLYAIDTRGVRRGEETHEQDVSASGGVRGQARRSNVLR